MKAVIEGARVDRVSDRRVRCQNALDRAFGAREKDWPAYYRALDALCRAVWEDAGGDADAYPSIDPPAEEGPAVAQYPACTRCKGAGETMVQDRLTTGGEPVMKVGECPACRGSGENRQKPKVVPKAKEEVPLKEPSPPSVEEAREYAVMQLTVEIPLGWPEVWGVIGKGGNPQNGMDWMGLFPSMEMAEKFRDAL